MKKLDVVNISNLRFRAHPPNLAVDARDCQFVNIVVAIQPGSRGQKIVTVDSGYYRIWVTSLPVKGKSNEEMTEMLAEYFKVRKGAIRIVIGKTAREKLVEISG